jgi:hypothetical protein
MGGSSHWHRLLSQSLHAPPSPLPMSHLLDLDDVPACIRGCPSRSASEVGLIGFSAYRPGQGLWGWPKGVLESGMPACA